MLSADLKAKLDSKALLDKFVGSIAAPAATLAGVSPPVSHEQLSGTAGISVSVSTTGIGSAVGSIGLQANGLLGGLPSPADAVKPLISILELLEHATAKDPAAQIQKLLDRLSAELSGPRNSSFLDLAGRVSTLLSDAPELKGLIDLLATVFQAARLDFSPTEVLGELPSAIGSTVTGLGALMTVKSLLAEGHRLTAIMALQFDPAQIDQTVVGLRSSFADAAATMAALAGSGGADAVLAQVSHDVVRDCNANLAAANATLAQAMGFGEATLVHLDIEAVKAGLQTAGNSLRAIDQDAIGRAIKSIVDKLTPTINLNLRAPVAQSLDALLKLMSDETAKIAAAISQVDLAALADPLQAGLAKITSFTDSLAGVINQITSAIRSALEQVRQAVAALPFDEIGRSVQTALAPVSQAMDAMRSLVGAVEGALKAAGQTVTTALGDIEKAVDTVKAELQALLQAAEEFVKSLHLDQAAGEINDKIRAVQEVLAKAQMKPYFDTASTAIDTATEVIGALPVAMLPDSMKSDLDAAVAPMREINVEQVKDDIEGLLDLENGKFELVAALNQALAEIQKDYDALLSEVKLGDPRQLIPQIDGALADVKTQIHSLIPQLNLKPLDDAVAGLKHSLASLDLRAELAPVAQVFAKVLAAIDEFSPDKLIKPLEDRLKTARERIVGAVALRSWAPQVDKLDAQARSMIDLISTQQIGLEGLLEEALGEAGRLVGQLDGINLAAPFGDFVAALLSGGGTRIHAWSFDAVAQWLTGGSADDELKAHATAIDQSITSTHDAVAALDLVALAAELTQRAAAMRAATDSLADGSALKADLRVQVGLLDVNTSFLTTLAGNQARYLARLQTAAAIAATLADTGLSQADATARALQSAFAPAAIFKEFMGRLLAQVGLSSGQGGVAGLLRGVLGAITPARLAGILNPIIDAVHGRIANLLDAVVTPIKTAIAHLDAAIDAIDLAPLRKAVDSVFQQVRAQIEALDPMKILAPVLNSFDALKGELMAFDPMKNLRDIINALTATADRVLDKLKGEALLADPIAIFDQIYKALSAIDPKALLQPVLDTLDNMAAQVSDGMDEVAQAIERLQAALPAPGSSGAGAVLSAAVSVSVSF